MNFDVSSALVELLFVRAAWDLDGPPGLPRPSPAPDTGMSARPGVADLEAAWSELWWAAARGEGARSWRIVYGVEGIDTDAMREWSNATRQGVNADVLGQDRPLRSTSLMSRAESGAAAGLSSIVIVPVDGGYAIRVTAHRLVVSEATYLEDAAWAAALAVQ